MNPEESNGLELPSAGNGKLVCIVIQLCVAIAILCSHCDFNTLLYHSVKSESHAASNTSDK